MDQTTVTLYPLSHYTFSTKQDQPEEDSSVANRLERLQRQYDQFGMRRSVEGVMLVHDHGVPHILVLQIASAFFRLPGDYLQPGEDEVAGFKRLLDDKLGLDHDVPLDPEMDQAWEFGEVVGQWWRPNFETFQYPYRPAHITKPKELKKVVLVKLPKKKVLCVPKNMKLLAIPVFEFYENTARYGPQLAALPQQLSRFNFVCAE